jgi:hypothetical protein
MLFQVVLADRPSSPFFQVTFGSLRLRVIEGIVGATETVALGAGRVFSEQ